MKSGKNADGRAVGVASRNITVRRCRLLRGHGLSIGSETAGGVADVRFEDLTFHGTAAGVRIKSQRGGGGVVAGVTYRNLTMVDVRQVGGRWRG